jgi:hypothetical protein
MNLDPLTSLTTPLVTNVFVKYVVPYPQAGLSTNVPGSSVNVPDSSVNVPASSAAPNKLADPIAPNVQN